MADQKVPSSWDLIKDIVSSGYGKMLGQPGAAPMAPPAQPQQPQMSPEDIQDAVDTQLEGDPSSAKLGMNQQFTAPYQSDFNTRYADLAPNQVLPGGQKNGIFDYTTLSQGKPVPDRDVSSDDAGGNAAQIGADAGIKEGATSGSGVDQADLPQSDTFSKPVSLSGDIDPGTDTINTPENLRAAQEKEAFSHLIAGLNRSSGLIGAGLSKTAPNQGGNDISNNIDKYAGDSVTNFKDQVKQESANPNSPTSVAFRQYLKRFGLNVSDDTSADVAGKIMPMALKEFEQKQAAQDKYDMARQSAKEHGDLMKFRYAALDAEKANKASEKDDKDTNTRFSKMNEKLVSEIASSRSAFGKGANNIRAAEAIEQLIGKANPNDLDSRQIAELARGLDSLLSQGQSTISGMNKLIPSTASGSVAKIMEYIQAIPKGAGQGAFVQRMLETVKREKKLAQEQVKRTQGKILAGYGDLKQKQPDRYADILKAHDLEDVGDDSSDGDKREPNSTELTPQQEAGVNNVMNKLGLSKEDAIKELKKHGQI